MKKTNIIVCALVLLLSVGCNRKIDFPHETFVTLNAESYKVKENAGSLIVPVTVYNPNGGEIMVTVAVNEDTALEGLDYEIVSPAGGVLFFSAGETTKDVEIKIVNHKNELTGSRKFDLTIASVTSGVSTGNFDTASITIQDLDHPLNDIFIGDWEGMATFGDNYGTQYPINISIVANDDDETYSTVFIQNLDPYMYSYGMTADKGQNTFKAAYTEEKGVKTLTIRSGQVMGDYNGSKLYLTGLNSAMSALGYDIVITKDDRTGTLTIKNGFGAESAEGLWTLFYGGIVLTKK